MSIEYLIVIYE